MEIKRRQQPSLGGNEINNKNELKHGCCGQQFGRLTVIHVFKDDKGYLKCICECRCGGVKEVYLSNLRAKRTRSCGCLEKESRRKKVDLTGCRVGYLVVSKPTEMRKDGCVVWECICDCGEVCYVTSRNLQSRTAKSCGCIEKRNNDITGKRFGRLSVIKAIGAEKGKPMIWECRCDCGNITQVSINNLKNGHTRSCGCLRDVEQFGHVNGTSLTIIGSKKLYKNNTSGVKGVSFYKGKCVANLTFKGVRHYLGSFQNEEDAIAARLEAEQMYFHPILAEFINTDE